MITIHARSMGGNFSIVDLGDNSTNKIRDLFALLVSGPLISRAPLAHQWLR